MKTFYSKTLTPPDLSEEGKKEFTGDDSASFLPKDTKPNTLTSPKTENQEGDNLETFPGREDRENDAGYGRWFKPSQDPYESFQEDGDPTTQTTLGPKEGADEKERELAKELVNKAKESARLNNIDPLKLFIENKKKELKSLPISFIKFDNFLNERIDEIESIEGVNPDIVNSIIDQFNKVLEKSETTEEFVKPSKERSRIEKDPIKFIEEEQKALKQVKNEYQSKVEDLEPKIQQIIVDKSSDIEKLISDYSSIKQSLEEKITSLDEVKAAPEILEKQRSLKLQVAELEKQLKEKKLELMEFSRQEEIKAFPEVIALMREADQKYSFLTESIQSYFNIAHKYGIDVLKVGDSFFMNYLVTEQRKHIDTLKNHMDHLKNIVTEYSTLESKKEAGELDYKEENRLEELQKDIDVQIKVLDKSDMISKKYDNNIMIIAEWVQKLKSHINESRRVMDIITNYNVMVGKESLPVADKLIVLTQRTIDQISLIENMFKKEENKQLEKLTSVSNQFERYSIDLKDIIEKIYESFSTISEWFTDLSETLDKYFDKSLYPIINDYNKDTETFKSESNKLVQKLDFTLE